MGPVTQKFRAALGGFNRQDVTRYLEQTAAEHRRRTGELEQRLTRAEQERDELRQELEGLRSERGDLAAEEARVRSSLEQSTRSLAKLRGELTQTETKLGVARSELERLQAQVDQLAPMAQRYEQLKDRVATVELDAHRKAQATIDEAQGQADALRNEARRWLESVLGEYDGLRTALDELMDRAGAVAAWRPRLEQVDDQAQPLREKAGMKHE